MRLQSSCAPYCSLRNRLAWGLLEVDVPKSILDHDGLLAVDHPPRLLWSAFDITQCGKQDPHRSTGYNPVSLRKHEHFCQVRSVYVPSTDPEPVTLHTGTKTILRTYAKPSIPMAFLPNKLFRL